MKIIITESQIEDIYFLFINKQVGDLYKRENVSKKNPYGVTEFKGSTFWLKDKEVLFELDSLDRLWIQRELFERFQSMFGTSYNETIDIFKNWARMYLVDAEKVFSAHEKNWGRWKNIG